MTNFIRLVSIVVAIGSLIGPAGPRHAGAVDTCPCASNSPVINPFPFKWIRWGTSQVLRGGSKCSIDGATSPAIAISEITPEQSKQVHGYQLIVVDLKNKNLLCKGADLIGVQFILSKGKQTAIIQHVARARITPDKLDLDKADKSSEKPGQRQEPEQPREEAKYRLAYTISDTNQPEDSLCTHGIHSARRQWWRPWKRRYKTIANPSTPSNKLDDLLELRPEQLASYAVVIPDAEYKNNVYPETPPSDGLPVLHIPTGYDSKPPYKPIWTGSHEVSLEWFEYACAGGALGHTELHGLVDSSGNGTDKQARRDVRTAALRMFSATYKGATAETLGGVPISFKRIYKDNPLLDPCRNVDPNDDIPDGRIESRWSAQGATCLSHPRRWMTDMVLTRDPDTEPSKSEATFRSGTKLRTCDQPDIPRDTDRGATDTPYFVSCALQHISH